MKVDLDNAVAAVVEELQGGLSSSNDQQPLGHSRETVAELSRTATFVSKFDQLILTELLQRPDGIQSETDKLERISGHVSLHDSSEQNTIGDYSGGPVRLPILTLYGGGPQPKQLFSSLQHPSTTQSRSLITPEPIREGALPNGISVSKVIPVHSIEPTNEKEKVPTLGELFPPPPSVQQLNPPRQSRLIGTRSTTVNWIKSTETVPSSTTHRRTYPMQPLATSQWLSYHTVPAPIPQASSDERRRQRDRVLSSGGAQTSRMTGATQAAWHATKEDALFCSVYSSFAPDKDSTGAIVPEHAKENIWWNKKGERKYRELVENKSREFTDDNVWRFDQEVPQRLDHEIEISADVDGWTPMELPRELLESTRDRKAPQSTSELDLLIGEISELLETLHSYQRIRHMSLTNSALTTANPELNGWSGSPATPSTGEFDLYSMLQSQLALIISTLPPYAVAKLNGDRLGSIKASTKIPVEGTNYVGAIEEEELLTKPRTISTSASVNYTPRPTNVNPPGPSRVNGYTHTPNAPPSHTIPRSAPGAIPRAGSTSTPQLPNQQYSSRPASSNHYFTGTAHSSYPPQRPTPMSTERYSHPKPPQYGQRPAPTPHTPLPNGFRAAPGLKGPSHSQPYATPSHGVLSPATGDAASKSQRPNQAGYQQKALNTVGHAFGSNTPGREASPSTIKASLNLPPPLRLPPGNSARPAMYPGQLPGPTTPLATAAPVNANGGSGGDSGSVATAVQASQLTRMGGEAVTNSQTTRLGSHEGPSRAGSGTPQPGVESQRAAVKRPVMAQVNGV